MLLHGLPRLAAKDGHTLEDQPRAGTAQTRATPANGVQRFPAGTLAERSVGSVISDAIRRH